MKRTILLLLCAICLAPALAQPPSGPKVLIVTAHPDDETTFPVTIYKITHDLHGTADLALLTDGQGGFGNPEFAALYYHLNLHDTALARAYLPAIRKQELMRGGQIMGLRNYFFFDQLDDQYSQNAAPYIGGAKWDIPAAEKKLDTILARTAYDFVLVLLPTPDQHAHHKSASLLALRAVSRLKGRKPVVLGALEVMQNELTKTEFQELPGYPETRIRSGVPPFTFDRRYRFGNFNAMNYMVVHDWVVAEYKSQGDTQANYMNKYDLEAFWYFDLNGDSGVAKTKKLFDDLKRSGFPTK